MITLFASFVLTSCIIILNWKGSECVIVRTECGPVEGFSKDGAFNFLGIPYASPPVAELRWRPPAELSKAKGNCWTGVYNASRYGNMCYQKSLFDHKTLEGSEDCLYLNILTPSVNSSTKKPVMVWIHGGFLEYASGNFPLYSPTPKLAHEMDIVFVSFNYRLHAFGFMALQMLADNSKTNTSGNYGFMDMIAVLKWVQNNIGNFGGDPNQVTVFGQSSGGTAIFALLASPLCQGLFHKAWLLSASPILNKTAADAFKDNEVFLQNANCSTIECLYSLSSKEVTEAVPWDTYPFWAMTDQNDIPLKNYFDGALAIVDGIVLKEAPFDAWTNGHSIDVPLLIGSCANEADYDPTFPDLNTWIWEQYELHLLGNLGTFNSWSLVETAQKFYPSHTVTPEYQLTSLVSDLRVNCPTDVMARHAVSTFKSPVYRYVVTNNPSVPVHPIGLPFPSSYAFHMWDVLAFFGFVPDHIKHPTTRDIEWQRNVQSEALSFVRNGKPRTLSWQTYPNVTLLLSDVSTPSEGYHSTECEFWLQNGFFSYGWIN